MNARAEFERIADEIEGAYKGLHPKLRVSPTWEERLRALASTLPADGTEAVASSGWIVVKEHAWDHEDGGRPTLAYLWPVEFNRQVFATNEAASAFLAGPPRLPLGWVLMEIKLPSPQPVRAALQAAFPGESK